MAGGRVNLDTSTCFVQRTELYGVVFFETEMFNPNYKKKRAFTYGAIFVVALFVVSYSVGVIFFNSFSPVSYVYAEGVGGDGSGGGGGGAGGDGGGGGGGADNQSGVGGDGSTTAGAGGDGSNSLGGGGAGGDGISTPSSGGTTGSDSPPSPPPPCPVAPPAVSGSASASAVVGTPFTYSFSQTGATSISVSGLLAGLSFDGASTISGMPTASGSSVVTVSVTNECGSAALNITITVDVPSCTLVPPTISGSGSDTISVSPGNPITPYTFTISGSAPTTSTSGALPTGVTFNPANLTISGTPTVTGTFTFTLNASNACGSASKTVTIEVTSGGGGCALPAPSLSTSHTSASVVLGNSIPNITLTLSGTVSATSTSGSLPPGVIFNPSTLTISGTPTANGTFSFTFKAENGCASKSVDVTITVSPGGGGGCTASCGGCSGSCGGGGPTPPSVILMKAATSTLASYGFIYLAKVPYTGVGDWLSTILFLLALASLSLGISYVWVYRDKLWSQTAWVLAYAGLPTVEQEDQTSKSVGGAEVAAEPLSLSVAVPIANAPVFSPRPAAISTEIAPTSSKSFAAGLSEEIRENISKVTEVKGKPAVSKTPTSFGTEVLTERVMEHARHLNAIIEKPAVEPILIAAEKSEMAAKSILAEIVAVAREWYPVKSSVANDTGDWLILTKDKVNKILFSTYLSMLPIFTRWLVSGEGEKIQNFLRLLNLQGQSLREFTKTLVYELDKVYRFRLENASGANGDLVDATASWNRGTFEGVISTLVSALDGYSSEYVAAKLAFAKAGEIATIKNPNTPYA